MDPSVTGTAWEVGCHTVLFFGREGREQKRVVEECGKLWDWLGVPRPFTVVLWWWDAPRQIAAGEWPSRATLNGGWTSQNSSTIFLYRQEEWDRVFLHEMIHALGWDWKMPTKPLACWGLPRDSKVTPALFEAWTELYAEWLWCVWHGRSWERQREWQDWQATQILARYRVLGMRSWREDTSVFAYYILKAALAPHMAELLLFGEGDPRKTLCLLAEPELRRLRQAAERVAPVLMSLRMTVST